MEIPLFISYCLQSLQNFARKNSGVKSKNGSKAASVCIQFFSAFVLQQRLLFQPNGAK